MRDRIDFAAKTEFELSQNIFAEMKLEYFCPKRREKTNWTWNIFVQKAKGRRGVK